MKKLFLMLSFAGMAMFTFAQNAPQQVPAPDPNAAEIKWESMTIDYGNVTKGDEGAANREFKFTNVGKNPLIITDCHGSCGCTVPTCPKEPIAPGKSGSIKVHYDINRVGNFTKTVTVTSNAKNANETLKITGNVNDPDANKAPATAPATTTPPNNQPH